MELLLVFRIASKDSEQLLAANMLTHTQSWKPRNSSIKKPVTHSIAQFKPND